MPPELFQDRSADERSDIYSLGVVLYRMLTGRLPFVGQPHVIAEAIQTLSPTPPTRLAPGIPRELESLCLRALEKDPENRYQTADQMAAALANVLQKPELSPAARRQRVTRQLLVGTAFVTLGLVLASVIIFIWQDRVEVVVKRDGNNDTIVEDHAGSVAGPVSRRVVADGGITLHLPPTVSQPYPHQLDILPITRRIETGPDVAEIELSADGRTLYAAYTEMGKKEASRLQAFDVESGELVLTTRSPDADYDHHGVAVSADERFAYLLNYFRDHITRVDLHNLENRTPLALSTRGLGKWGSGIEITPDQQRLAVTTGGNGPNHEEEDEQLSIIDVADGQFSLAHEVMLPGHVGRFMMGLSGDGQYVYVLCLPHQGGSPILCKVSLSSPYEMTPVTLPKEFGPVGDGFTLCVGGRLGRIFFCDTDGKRIQVMDVDRTQIVDTFQVEGFHPAVAALHPRDALLVVDCPSVNKVLLISAVDGRPVARIDRIHTAGGRPVFSPDGRWLYVALRAPQGGVAVVDLQSVLAAPGIVFASNRGGEGYQNLSRRFIWQAGDTVEQHGM
ncbi:MAG: protein kinase domain-containing protein [Pirellulaceae bacterium]